MSRTYKSTGHIVDVPSTHCPPGDVSPELPLFMALASRPTLAGALSPAWHLGQSRRSSGPVVTRMRVPIPTVPCMSPASVSKYLHFPGLHLLVDKMG